MATDAREPLAALIATWRACAPHAGCKGERATWELCADELEALLRGHATQVDEDVATAIAWPQDVAGLIEMAHDWPQPVSDGGDMFSGDVLIKKLGHALEALLTAKGSDHAEPDHRVGLTELIAQLRAEGDDPAECLESEWTHGRRAGLRAAADRIEVVQGQAPSLETVHGTYAHEHGVDVQGRVNEARYQALARILHEELAALTPQSDRRHLFRCIGYARAFLAESESAKGAAPGQAPPANTMNPPCQGCGGPHPFDTTVPSVRWNAVIRAAGLPDYLCLTCIVRAFALAGESFTADLTDGTGPLVFLPIEIRVRSQEAVDAQRLSEENTALRVQLRDERFQGGQASPSPPPAWMPIESAPKDGTWFLAWDYDCGFYVFRDGPGFIESEGPQPTYWMPLPDPPSRGVQGPAASPKDQA